MLHHTPITLRAGRWEPCQFCGSCEVEALRKQDPLEKWVNHYRSVHEYVDLNPPANGYDGVQEVTLIHRDEVEIVRKRRRLLHELPKVK